MVSGYGWCGKGVAMRAKGLGAHVVVTEVDPLRALEALMDGFEVMEMAQAAKTGDIFVTVTGDIHVLRKEHFERMKDGAIVCNSGHFNVEVDIAALEAMKTSKRRLRPFLDEYALNRRKEDFPFGRGPAHQPCRRRGPSFGGHGYELRQPVPRGRICVEKGKTLEKKVYGVPVEIDKQVAMLKLKTRGVSIDKLTREQSKYLSSWEMGT